MEQKPKKALGIPSYGVVLFCKQGSRYYFLLVKRKTTIAWSEIESRNLNKKDIPRIANQISEKEKKKIRNLNVFFPNSYMSKFIFPLREYLLTNKTKKCGEPWLFPKGRKCKGETCVATALRELEEEAFVKRKMCKYSGYSYVTNFIGTNGQPYSTTLFLFKFIYPLDFFHVPERFKNTNKEISDVNFFTLRECISKVEVKYLPALIYFAKNISAL